MLESSGADDDFCQYSTTHHSDCNTGEKNDKVFYELHAPRNFTCYANLLDEKPLQEEYQDDSSKWTQQKNEITA